MNVGIASWWLNQYPKDRWIEQSVLRSGHKVTRLYSSVRCNDPDLDFILFIQAPPFDFDNAYKSCPWVWWTFDHVDEKSILHRYVPVDRMDLVFAKTPIDHPGYRYLDQGAPDHWYPDNKVVKDIDILFPAIWRKDRQELLASLPYCSKITVAGRKWPLISETEVYLTPEKSCKYVGPKETEEEMRDVFTRSKVVFGDRGHDFGYMETGKDTPGYKSDRCYLATACGAYYCGPESKLTAGQALEMPTATKNLWKKDYEKLPRYLHRLNQVFLEVNQLILKTVP